MTQTTMTPKQYAVSLGLTKPGRGRMSQAAKEAIAAAVASGMTFTNPKEIAIAPKVTDDGNSSASFGCGGCTNRWNGLSTAHCKSCHNTFSVCSNFDKHRKNGSCVSPSSVGLVQNSSGIWAMPGKVE